MIANLPTSQFLKNQIIFKKNSLTEKKRNLNGEIYQHKAIYQTILFFV
jgi:hypothetical protein